MASFTNNTDMTLDAQGSLQKAEEGVSHPVDGVDPYEEAEAEEIEENIEQDPKIEHAAENPNDSKPAPVKRPKYNVISDEQRKKLIELIVAKGKSMQEVILFRVGVII